MISPSQIFHDINPDMTTNSMVRWIVRRDLPYFNGHFPESPILPAIAIIEASTHLLERALKQPQLRAKSILNAKFLSPIVPEQKIRITWKNIAPGEWQLDWNEESSNKLLATLCIQL